MVYESTPKRKPIRETTCGECGLMLPMQEFHTAVTGREGEDAAVLYLQSKGYDVRERNVYFGRLEIDIVAYDRTEKMMVFVEVKARRRGSLGYPIRTAVDTRKRKALRAAVHRWAVAHRYEGPGRIDIVCVADGRIVDHVVNIGSDFY